MENVKLSKIDKFIFSGVLEKTDADLRAAKHNEDFFKKFSDNTMATIQAIRNGEIITEYDLHAIITGCESMRNAAEIGLAIINDKTNHFNEREFDR